MPFFPVVSLVTSMAMFEMFVASSVGCGRSFGLLGGVVILLLFPPSGFFAGCGELVASCWLMLYDKDGNNAYIR